MTAIELQDKAKDADENASKTFQIIGGNGTLNCTWTDPWLGFFTIDDDQEGSEPGTCQNIMRCRNIPGLDWVST